MASSYDRILASRQRFREQANLTQDDYAAFQQAYVQQFDAKDLAQGTRQAADELRTVLQKPAGVDKPETIRKAYNNYESYMQKARAYTKAGGSLSGGAFLPMQEEDFAKQREDFQKLMQESIQMQKGTQGALGRITALGARVDDAALRENTSTGQLPPGLLDEKTGLPTETAWAAWEKNRLRTAYQDAAQTAGQQLAAITQRQKQQADEAERLEGVLNVLRRLNEGREISLITHEDAVIKQQAKIAGITDYQDAADLQRQVETRLGRLGRIQDRTAARAADKAGEVRTARALEYQLDNPSESLDANALKWERDQAAREAAQGLTLHSAANFLRANNAYAQQRYTDEKWKDISAIRNDPTLSGDYQTALEATRTANAAGEALGYLQSDIRRDGAVTRDTAMQARHIASQAGITLPDDDAALAGYLARLTKQEGARLQYALAGLTAAGYDEEKLQQYIKQSLNEQQMDEYTASARESAAAHPVGTSLASSAANLVGGMGYLAALPRTVANTWNAATGNYDAYIPIDENANSFRATKYAQTVREEVARQLQEKYPDGEFLGQNTAAFLYDTGMSMLDNITQVMVGMGLVGAGAMQEAASGGVAAMVRAGTEAASPVSLGVMGLTTASQKLQELTAQGVDATTAYTLATAAGSIEVLTEKMGLDEFINGLGRQTAATTLRQLGKQLGRQMLAEGTEEAASDILNLAADALVRWDQNDFAKAIEEKRRQGYNEGDAVWACISDQLLSTAGSFAGGALAGAGFGLGGFAMNAASNTNPALGRAAQSAEGFADLQRAAEAYGVDLGDLTQSSSAQALGAMRRQVLAAAEQEAKQVDAFAKQKGYKKNAADALQTAFASYRDTGANGMTAAEFAVAFDTAYQEGRLDAQYGNPGAYLKRAAQDGLTAGLPGKTIQYAYLTGTQDGAKQTAKLGNPIRAARDAAAERRAQKAQTAAAADAPKGTLRVIALDAETATVQTADGKRVGVDKLEADSAQRKIILQAQDDGYGAQVANAMLEGYDGKTAPESYYEAYRDAMTAAWEGGSLQDVLHDAGTALPAKSVKAAWETGREIAARDAIRERIGPAGQQMLDRLAPEQTEVFEKYYKAGLEGKSFDQARKEIGQVDAGLNSTLRAAVRAGARDAQGGFTYGERADRDAGHGRVRDVGAGREDGTVERVAEADAGGEGAAVEAAARRPDAAGSGGQEQEVEGQKNSADSDERALQLAMERARAKQSSAAAAERVSAQELGIGNGTDRKALRVIGPEQLTQEQREVKEALRKQGIILTFVEGRIELTGRDRATHYAKGVCVKQKNAIVVRTDAKMPWQKIVKHEAQHMAFAQNPALLGETWRQFLAHMEMAELERWIAGYAERYGGLYDATDLEGLIEEALCDVAAEVDAPAVSQRYWKEEFPQRKEAWKQGRNVSDAALYQMDQDAGGQKNSAQVDRAMTEEELRAIQSIGNKSVNQFTSEDIRRVQRYAQQYWKEMGTKSPFFRAWFGDWRANDRTAVQTAKRKGSQRGLQRNADTGWEINISRKVFTETEIKRSPAAISAAAYLPYIQDIVEKAVLLDTYAMKENKAKSLNSLLMHSLYAVADNGSGPVLLKLYVEEMNDPNQAGTSKRAYELQNIECRQLNVKGSRSRASLIITAADVKTVADLFQAVKYYDKNFNPKQASKVVNADGTPKVVYHGTNQEFHTFQSQNGAYFFSESQDYAESMAEERGGDRIIQAYLDMRRPLRVEMQPGEFSDPNYEAKYLREAKAKGHDGVIFTLRTGNELVDDTFYAVFNSAQIKSATENIGTFDKAEQDIRYSAEDDEDAADWTAESQDLARELEDAQKRKKALEAVNRKLREQMKVTPPDTADQRELRGAAKRLAENYGGGLRQKDLTKQLQSIWRLRAEAQRGSEENRREKRGQMNEELEQLAAELTRNYLDKDNPEAETLREIRRIVRTTKIQLTPELRGDLDREGGYRDFRQRNWGRMRLANSGLGVDQLYQELSEQWPAYFPEGIWNPADQLMQIADVIQDGTTILARSPYGDQDGMQYMKTKILWELGAVPAAQPTLADQAAQGAYREEALRRGGPGAGKEQLIDATAAHEQEQMDQLDAWYRDHLRKVKADREDQIQKVKDRYQERAQAERDRKAEQELKRRLLWHGNRLKRMGRTATPEQQAEIGKIIGEINLACQNMTKTTVVRDYIQGMSTESIPADGYRDRADPRRTMSAEEAAQNPEMRGDKVVDVSELKAWYEEQKKSNPDFIADRRVEEILANMDKKQIGEMTPREVQQLLDVALNIENEIRTQKKLIDTADRREVYQQVLEVIGDIESTRGRGDRNLPKVIGAVKDGGRWLVDGTLTPVRLLRRFTGYQDNDPLYRAALDLQQGELKQLDYQRRAYARFESFTKDRKFMDYLAGKGKQKPIEITGMNERGEQVTCRITPDMRVALYLHSKNYQNLRHIQRGGIEVPNYAAYVAGRYTDAYDKATRLRLAPGTVRAIGETMTTREKNYAEAIRKYYNTMSKAEINAVSVKLKGYEVAKVGEYYPIATNRDFVVKEFDAIKYDGSLESFGFLKERKEGGTPILLADATRTLERSIQSHSAYIGMAIPMRNFNKLRGVSVMASDEAGAVRYQEKSLMDTLRKQWGTTAVKRLETMVADLSGSKPRENGMGMLNRIRSNYAGAVLELNPSTGMKQLIAYPSAASVLGWDAMAVGLTKWQKVDVKLISQYTPLLWHRMQGFIDSDLGDFAKNHGHRPKFLNWNQAGDLAVVKQIWKAAEWKVAHENPALLHDVEAWHKATAAFFNRVVLESQANYTTMERGELLRTNNVFWRSISMFKTEPFQALNVLYDGFANVAAKRRQLAAAQQLANEEGGKETVQAAETAYREAKKRVAQAIPAVIASNLLEAAITFAWALFRGKDKDWRDEETDEITAASFFKKMFIQAGSNIAGVVPFGSEMAEFLQAALLGDRYYGVETLETSAIADVLQGVLRIKTSLEKALNEENDEYEARAARGDFFKEMLDQMMQLGMATGVPVDNIAKIAKGLLRWGFIAALGKNEGEFQYRAWLEKSTASGRGSADADALFRAALDGDEESMDRMYAAMAKTKSEDSIQAAIRKRTKDAVDSGDVDLETAVGILQRFQTDTAADDLYWDVRGWQYMAETGAESFGKYNILKDAIFSGGDATAALQELEAHGVSREDAEGEIRSTIGEWYQGKSEDGRTVDRDQAVKLLQEYGGNSKHDAEEAVTKWDCYVETGIDYSDLKQQYVAGTLSDSEAKQYLQDYGAKRDREADKQIKQWDCKKDTGIDFDDIKAEYLAGSIDKNKAVELRQKYGGSSEEDAQTLVLQWDCKKDTDIDYEDIKWALIDGDITEAKAAELWKKYGGKDDGEAANKAAAWKLLGQHQELIDQYDSVESLAIKYIQHGNGAPIADFFDYYRKVKSFEADRDAEGKTISGSRKEKVVAYIADLPLTAAQKDGLMLADNAKYKLDDMPW